MLLQDARHEARFASGELVLLAEQDRSQWDAAELAGGRERLDRAIALGGRGAYVLQAAIAALHTEESVDWEEIAALYSQLAELTGSPVVELNRAVAIAEAGAPRDALELIETLELDGYHYFHSTRAELLRRLDRDEEARAACEKAASETGLPATDPVRFDPKPLVDAIAAAAKRKAEKRPAGGK
jgi:RNA polymerase sigma-70 factor (ECF subfamily)